ncbi:MAG: bifunctional acetate--CoA ligase family protein/GNAT family N-acetyltransferase, partial [Candidatus Polarisedimenticolia bacterium]
RKGGIRIVGPNCLGVMSPVSNFNATFARSIARPGRLGFISQSGALCTSVLDWAHKENVGFSAFVSIGSMSDVGWGDLIDYLGQDPKTEAILIYMESVGDARAFLSAAREVALTKPIIVIKVGRTAAAAKAAASHTGSLTGSDDVLDAAFRRCGVLRVDQIADLFNMAEVLAKQPRPKGKRLTIVTNAGGPGVLATDALISSGAELTDLSPETMAALNETLPAQWSHNNPVDILGDGKPDRYAKTLEIVAKDPNSDGMMVILTPQEMTEPTATAECLAPYAHFEGKPVLASWMGGLETAPGDDILNKAGIPTFPYPDDAAKAFVYMHRYAENLKGLYETPSLPTDKEGAPDRALVARLIENARKEGRTILTEHESKQVLAAYRIPTVPTVIAQSADEAAAAAEKVGFPVVLKLFSETITHKTDVGGVKLNLTDAPKVREAFEAIHASVERLAKPEERVGGKHFMGVTVQPMIKLEGYEVILGASPDPQFGPVLLFGMGGQLVEVFKDRALGLPPLTSTLARRMMERTKIYTALKGVRGRKPVDMAALEQLLVRFSQLLVEQPLIKELDINPLLASPERLLALDARVVVYPEGVDVSKLPRPAIAPYPQQYVASFRTKKGTELTIRPVRPEDEPAMVAFHHRLSAETVRARFMADFVLSERVAHERLTRVCFVDYAREMAVIAEDAAGEIVAASRVLRRSDGAAEFSVMIADALQGQGLGKELLKRMVGAAKDLGFPRVVAEMLPDNAIMIDLFRKAGFRLVENAPAGRTRAVLAF